MKDWWKPVGAVMAILTFVGIFVIVPMHSKIDTLKDEKADSVELEKKVDQDVFDLTVTNIEKDIEELKKGQEKILDAINAIPRR